ncbi:transmembrane amino acid transporter protein-domain-containing protein [Lipomyces kononenkoae]|uniref:Transmembrane amino acid transporter protein-domain-containing protein n=1 Tax=Lipomyces kononenkoae TaxID=34357 RepID=A0ACC3T801_LIPKO
MASRKSLSEESALQESHSVTGRTSLSDDDDLAPYRVEDNDPISLSLQRTLSAGQHESLLARIEAPAVVLAEAAEANAESELPGVVGKKKNGMRMAFMNMANSIIGAGIIGQPYALLQCGLLTGVVLLFVLTLVIDWTIRLMVVNAKLSGTNTYQATVSACFGRPGYLAISLAQGLFAFGGSIAFTVIIGDTIPQVITAIFPSAATTPIVSLLTERQPVMIFCIIFISFPLSLSKNIANLAKASLLALISMLIIIVAVVVEGIRTPADQRGEFTPALLTINSGVFQGIGVISFAFVCHHNSLLIYGALRKPTLDRFARVTHWSTGVSMVACMTLALGGFLTFRNRTAGNVLNNFPADNIFINIARFCFGFNMLTTFPLEIFVCREVILDYIYSTFFKQITNEHGIEEPPEPSMLAHRLTTASLTLVTLLVALTTDSLGIVLEVVGSTSACMLAYILPPLCYLKLASSANCSWKQKVGPVACVVFGVTVMIVSTALSIMNFFTTTHDDSIET